MLPGLDPGLGSRGSWRKKGSVCHGKVPGRLGAADVGPQRGQLAEVPAPPVEDTTRAIVGGTGPSGGLSLLKVPC